MMKGSHTVERFLDWFMAQDNIPIVTRLHFSKKVKHAADVASATGKSSRVDITKFGEVVMSIRIYEDGSCELGYPSNLKWYGTPKPAFIPPEEKEL